MCILSIYQACIILGIPQYTLGIQDIPVDILCMPVQRVDYTIKHRDNAKLCTGILMYTHRHTHTHTHTHIHTLRIAIDYLSVN